MTGFSGELMFELHCRPDIALPSRFVREILARHALEGLFDTIAVSAEEGCAKPDPAIYRRLLERMAVRAPDAIMIDDKADNIAGARTAGMQGILFESAAKLATDLAKRTVLPDSSP